MIVRTTSRGALALATVLVIATPLALSQSQPSPPAAAPCPASDPNSPAKPCVPAKKPSTADQFPFPGASDAPPANTPDSPEPAPATPSHPSTTPSQAAQDHPFPTDKAPSLPGDDSSSSSSSSSGGTDSDADTAPLPRDTGAEGTSVHRKLPKPVHVQSDDERVDEDLTVARFYMRDDNLPGAYLRAKDAVKVQPEYSNAHFALAQVAQKMKKKDEAVAEYQTYLKLDPDGEKAKDAKRALSELR